MTSPLQHDGQPLSPEDLFSVAPDGAIGRVISSQTNKTRSGWKAMVGNEWNVMVGLAVVAFLVGGVLGLVLVDQAVRALFAQGIWQPMEYRGALSAIVGLVFAVIPTAMVVAIGHLMRKERITWVGEQGVQRWEKGVLGTKSEVFRFQDASSLTTQRTRHYYNGAYTGTSYNYTWWGPQGKAQFVIAGQYREADAGVIRGKPPAAHDPVHFAFAAERGWSRHRIALIDHELAVSGVAHFGTTGGKIRIGRGAARGTGWVELETGGKVERLERSQIESASVQQGYLTIKRVGAKEGWFSSDGVFRFAVAGMADFTVFIAIFEEQLGIRLA